ncbi:MAG: MBL fold metallo-hydrolase [Eubacteriales bacterium]
MKIKHFHLGIIRTNAYVGINEETKEAFVVDPGEGQEHFLNYFEEEGYALKGILLTHGHFDHIGGVEALVKRYGAAVYAMEDERALLKDPAVNLSNSTRRKMSIVDFVSLTDGEEIEVAGIKIKAIATPGHTAGGVCYYVEENGVLFSGDTLFLESIGRSDFPTGSYGTLIRSVKEKLLVLPEDTIVYPGHMDATTIEHEKQHNPYIG